MNNGLLYSHCKYNWLEHFRKSLLRVFTALNFNLKFQFTMESFLHRVGIYPDLMPILYVFLEKKTKPLAVGNHGV